ncbi:polysaccharide biosynthesis C-terminal domain-containing protein [Endozoicomonas sp. G2_1]|uniref:polysaccharide biosynthesis C-terminal domain-containing protein n=1 Tax=Endozoicomonas sp. G2_1 TaxID=2821091 RepID=UPI001AD993A8|nr:polysaccharide biosynthesis C-terminal domain-containing protein [Endozoicomonas sp. G2_1]MBO9488991.1 polysaccharide biosynthesis C-terminal domain-containing protein [Endozoicomonas sp. G2_1]
MVSKVIALGVGPVVTGIVGVILIPLMSWVLPVELVAKYTLLQAALNLSVVFFSLALYQAFVRFYYDVKADALLLKAASLPSLLFILLVYISFLVFDVRFTELITGEYLWGAELLFLSAIFIAVCNAFLLHLLRMNGSYLYYSITMSLPSLSLLIILLAYSILGDLSSVLVLFYMIFIAQLITFFVHLFISRKLLVQYFSCMFDIVLVKRLLTFSAPLVFSSVAYWGLTSIDRFYVNKMSNEIELALLGVSVSIASAVNVLTSIFSNIWHPYIYSLETLPRRKIKFFVNLICFTIILIWSLVSCFSFIVGYILPVEYNEVSSLLLLCIASPLLYLVSEATGVGIGYYKKTIYNMVAAVLALMLNIALNYLFVPKLGAEGAAIATAISFFLFFILKTELSLKAGFPIYRFKIYLLVLLCLSNAITVNYFNYSAVLVSLLYSLVLVLLVFIYRKELWLICLKIRKVGFKNVIYL